MILAAKAPRLLLLLAAFGPVGAFLAPSHSCHRARLPRGMVGSDASDLLYQEQEKVIVQRGEKEEAFLDCATPLEAPVVKVRGSGKAGGFGKAARGSDGSKAGAKAEGNAYAKVLRREGVLRIDGALQPATADAVRQHLYDLRCRSEREVREGTIQPIQRFAEVLLKHNRCDLTVPVGEGQEVITKALRELLVVSPVGATIASFFGDGAILHELSCLMSDPGSHRQVIHPDTPYIDGKGPVLFTCFVALQDVTLDMGPTVWLPRTHNQEAHAAFADDRRGAGGDDSAKDALLKAAEARLGLLPKGSCAIFDSRLLHCGTANRSADAASSRALFYCSFKDPAVGYTGNPASIRRELARAGLTLGELRDEVAAFGAGRGSSLLDRLGRQMT